MLQLQEVLDVLQWLVSRGAMRRLVTHSEIVGRVAVELSDAFSAIGVKHDRTLVIVGAAVHDVGKLVHPEELDGLGNRHELAGKRLLLKEGISPELVEMCVAHATWTSESTLEQLIVAVSDRIWRGNRTPDLEALLAKKVAAVSGTEPWAAYLQVDRILSKIAEHADERLSDARAANNL